MQHVVRSVVTAQVAPAHFVVDDATTLSVPQVWSVEDRPSGDLKPVEQAARAGAGAACERRRWGLEGERCGAGRREVITDDETTCCDRGCARGGTLGMSM